jgi:hypothetical protein
MVGNDPSIGLVDVIADRIDVIPDQNTSTVSPVDDTESGCEIVTAATRRGITYVPRGCKDVLIER